MKKLLVIILVLVYTASVLGVTFSFHYCKGKFKEVCFTADTEKNCCGKHENHKKRCCSDKVVKASCKDNHIVSSKSFLHKTDGYALVPQAYYYRSGCRPFPARISHTIKVEIPPPLLISESIYLLNRVLRV